MASAAADPTEQRQRRKIERDQEKQDALEPAREARAQHGQKESSDPDSTLRSRSRSHIIGLSNNGIQPGELCSAMQKQVIYEQ